jgi:capsid protein
MILKICYIKGVMEIPKDFMKQIVLAQDWLPSIPRDREAQVNEIVVLYGSGLMSLEEALVMRGNTRNVEETKNQIREDQIFQASLQMQMNASGQPSSNKKAPGPEKPKPQLQKPVVTTGLTAND